MESATIREQDTLAEPKIVMLAVNSPLRLEIRAQSINVDAGGERIVGLA
ncbi:MAG: hypothetical protein JJ992_23360 [Planctomycetes bacterium]|nr:hypothetical protein [Planctomycetota bacterium]